MRAVVVQKEKNRTYVMTQDGQFKCLKNLQNVQIGETIELQPDFEIYKNIGKIVIAASLIFALIFAIINFKPPEVYAYVYIDINPSIEVSIDKNGKIINAVPLNEDGKKILDKLPYKGLDITTFLAQTVVESQKLGFLKEEDTVIITTVPVKNSQVINEDIQKAVNNIKKTNAKIQIETLKSSKAQREEAKKEKTSPGRLILWENAKREGVEIPKDKLNSSEFFKELKEAYTKIKDYSKNKEIEKNKEKTLSKVKITPDKPIKIKEKELYKEETTQKIKNVKDKEVKNQNTPVKKEENNDNISKLKDNESAPNTQSQNSNASQNNNTSGQKEESKAKPVSDNNKSNNSDKTTVKNIDKNVKEIENYPPKDNKNNEEYNEKMKEVKD